jgi:hypothetical protein
MRWNPHALISPPFGDQDFTPTRYHSTADKAWFANNLCRFIASDFAQKLWTRRLYETLRNTCGHIAHYNKDGFWDTFFTSTAQKIAFLEQTIQHPCYGQPDYTFCDVERKVKSRIRLSEVLAGFKARLAAETEQTERALLARLREKYDGLPPATPADLASFQPIPASTSRRTAGAPGQASLF